MHATTSYLKPTVFISASPHRARLPWGPSSVAPVNCIDGYCSTFMARRRAMAVHWSFCSSLKQFHNCHCIVLHINNRHTPNINAAVPVQTPISHCSVENLTASSLSLSCAFSRFKSSLTDACVRCISSRKREFSFASSFVRRSCDARVRLDSVESAVMSSERSLAKSTFCV